MKPFMGGLFLLLFGFATAHSQPTSTPAQEDWTLNSVKESSRTRWTLTIPVLMEGGGTVLATFEVRLRDSLPMEAIDVVRLAFERTSEKRIWKGCKSVVFYSNAERWEDKEIDYDYNKPIEWVKAQVSGDVLRQIASKETIMGETRGKKFFLLPKHVKAVRKFLEAVQFPVLVEVEPKEITLRDVKPPKKATKTPKASSSPN